MLSSRFISNHWSFLDKEGETFSMEIFHSFSTCFSTRSEAECGNFEEILWKLSGKSEWKTFPLEYPENGSWLQIYLSSSTFGVFPLVTIGVGGAGTTPTYIATPTLDCHAHNGFSLILRTFSILYTRSIY